MTSKSGFPKIQTMFFEWCCKYFAQPMKHAAEDTESAAHYEHKYRCLQASHIQADASVELRKTSTYAWFFVAICNISISLQVVKI